MNVKACSRCGKHFIKPAKYSTAQWQAKMFCSRRCAGLKRKVPNAEIASMYQRGESSTQIAELFGLSGTHVLRILREAGVSIRQASENKRLSQSRPEVRKKMSEAATGRALPESAKQRLRERVGSKNHNWVSGITMQVSGYLQFTASVANGEQAGKFLHTVIAEWKLGRKLLPGEVVHHKDRNKLNNDPNNLEVMTASEHAKLHIVSGEFVRKRKMA